MPSPVNPPVDHRLSTCSRVSHRHILYTPATALLITIPLSPTHIHSTSLRPSDHSFPDRQNRKKSPTYILHPHHLFFIDTITHTIIPSFIPPASRQTLWVDKLPRRYQIFHLPLNLAVRRLSTPFPLPRHDRLPPPHLFVPQAVRPLLADHRLASPCHFNNQIL